MHNSAESPLLKVPEVAARLDVSHARAYELVRSGAFPAVRVGRQIRIDPGALQAWIDGGGTPLPGGWKREPE